MARCGGFFVQALTMLGALDAAYDLASRSVDEGVSVGMVGSRIYLADFCFRKCVRSAGTHASAASCNA